MDVKSELLAVLDETLGLQGRAAGFDLDTPLLGALPELDSMAVVSLIAGLETHFGITVDDDDIDGSTFSTVGALVQFVDGKLAA
ncbi:MAG: acyl carrier protein [Aquincola tertiaricarbonis]|uniref:acyl carrier protein n=1 Tax=Aquincola TaxID=391952 RepID=UPI000614D025|nr:MULTISPECIES: acyl carrier protein [Aquincola]MCR5866037.1 acyl carrier protein [Aquincola sp. J276]